MTPEARGSLHQRLTAASRNGEVVRIVYRGGSQPGTLREIVPISVTNTDVVARDVATGITKTFKLAKIESEAGAIGPQIYDPGQARDRRSIREAIEAVEKELQLLGWHVAVSDNYASLHRFFKNGKPRKAAVVQVWFDEFTVDGFDDGDGLGMQEVVRPSKLPYHACSIRVPTRSYADLRKALLLFLDEAKALAASE